MKFEGCVIVNDVARFTSQNRPLVKITVSDINGKYALYQRCDLDLVSSFFQSHIGKQVYVNGSIRTEGTFHFYDLLNYGEKKNKKIDSL